MEISLFLAKFWGWYLFIFFFVLSFNPIRIKQIFEDLKDHKFLIVAASMLIIIGLVSVLLHNVWKADWRFIITALGWLFLFIGLGLFVFPDRTTKSLETINIKLVQVLYVLLLLMGFFLLNKGYELLIY